MKIRSKSESNDKRRGLTVSLSKNKKANACCSPQKTCYDEAKEDYLIQLKTSGKSLQLDCNKKSKVTPKVIYNVKRTDWESFRSVNSMKIKLEKQSAQIQQKLRSAKPNKTITVFKQPQTVYLRPYIEHQVNRQIKKKEHKILRLGSYNKTTKGERNNIRNLRQGHKNILLTSKNDNHLEESYVDPDFQAIQNRLKKLIIESNI